MFSLWYMFLTYADEINFKNFDLKKARIQGTLYQRRDKCHQNPVYNYITFLKLMLKRSSKLNEYMYTTQIPMISLQNYLRSSPTIGFCPLARFIGACGLSLCT